MYKYPGFFVQTRTLRKYPRNSAAHILGYIGEVNQKVIDQDSYYKSGDYIGKSGLEYSRTLTLSLDQIILEYQQSFSSISYNYVNFTQNSHFIIQF